MAKFDMLTPAKEAELKENLWKIAKFEKAIKQEEDKLVSDSRNLAQSADDALAEMDAGLSQFREKMKAKKAESEATLREHDAELAKLAPSDAASAPVESAPEKTEPEKAESTFKMSKFSRGRPKKDRLDEIKA